jgi:glyoxylase-like metal-dependent hydrolase (beta-lactamase superfamily II)
MRADSKPRLDGYLVEGQTVTFGNLSLQVLHTPGHSPGSVSFHGGGDVFVGDVLFAGSIGRTDLPGGSYPTLIQAVEQKLFPLGDEVVVWPGHGPATTIGEERRYNPFFNGSPLPLW